MKSLEDIENRVAQFNVNPRSELRSRVLDEALELQRKQEQKSNSDTHIWRTIMKSPLTKVAASAVIIVTVMIGAFMFDRTSSVTWAIEQSIEVLSKYKAVVSEGLDSERTWIDDGSPELKPFKSWAVANKDQTMVEKYRHEIEGNPIITTNGRKTWRYDPQTNAVRVENQPYIASQCWCGSRFLEQLKTFHESGTFTHWDETYAKDPHTGKQQVLLKIAWRDGRFNGPRSIMIEIDVESKLLVRFKQWENDKWEGPATLIVDKITYHEKLSDDLFEFEIPDGATVIEH